MRNIQYISRTFTQYILNYCSVDSMEESRSPNLKLKCLKSKECLASGLLQEGTLQLVERYKLPFNYNDCRRTSVEANPWLACCKYKIIVLLQSFPANYNVPRRSHSGPCSPYSYFPVPVANFTNCHQIFNSLFILHLIAFTYPIIFRFHYVISTIMINIAFIKFPRDIT